MSSDRFSALSSPVAYLLFYLTAGIGLALDLWTKSLAFTKFSDASESYPFIPGWLEFQRVTNHGAVFGLGQGDQLIFIAVSIAAIIFLNYLFATSKRRWLYQILLGMLLAGVMGNLYDRITLHYVRDMIHAVPRWPKVFPWVFNVADSFLCVGVGLMIIYSTACDLRAKREQQKTDVGKSNA
jgi:signal peptidase II